MLLLTKVTECLCYCFYLHKHAWCYVVMLTAPDSSATVVLITVNTHLDLTTLCSDPSVNTTASSLLPLSGMIYLMPSLAAVSLGAARISSHGYNCITSSRFTCAAERVSMPIKAIIDSRKYQYLIEDGEDLLWHMGNGHCFQGDNSFLWFNASSDNVYISTQAMVKGHTRCFRFLLKLITSKPFLKSKAISAVQSWSENRLYTQVLVCTK